MKRICSSRSKFYYLTVDPMLEGRRCRGRQTNAQTLFAFFYPLKCQTKIAADDILFFYLFFSKKIRLGVASESSD